MAKGLTSQPANLQRPSLIWTWRRAGMRHWPERRPQNMIRLEPHSRSILKSWPERRASSSARDGLMGKAGIIGIDDVGQLSHFTDGEPFQFGMFIADVGGLTALPRCNGIHVV